MPRPTPRSAVLALALLVPAPSLAGWWALYLSPGAAGQIVFALLKVWVLALPAVWTVLVDRERLRIPPLRREGFGAALTFSALAGAGILGFYFLVGRRIVDLDSFRETVMRAGLTSPARYIGAALYWTLLNSLLEEYVWRWFVVTRLVVLVRRGAAVFLSALFFTAHHAVAGLAYFSWDLACVICVGVFLGGAVWSWIYARYQNFWAAWVSHVLIDAVVFWVGYDLLFGL